MPYFLRFRATFAYILAIILINSLFSYTPTLFIYNQPFCPIDVTVGSIYIFRDFSQREIKHYVLVAMLVGGVLSYIFAVKEVAFASIMAFFVAEIIDWIIFTWTRKPLSQRLLLSALCSCPIDSLVFLYLIQRLHALEFILMTLAKFVGVIAVWWYWKTKSEVDLGSIPSISTTPA